MNLSVGPVDVINPLKPKLIYITHKKEFGSYLIGNTCLHYKDKLIVLFREIIYSGNYMKSINSTVWAKCSY
jgi:hypothetical protein